jgi:DNA-binding NarL/FixJ family response regulator
MLTDRELQVITAILKSNNPGKIIANELGISESTLRNKLSVIYEKLGVHNRQGLFSYAHENGLI